MKKLTAMILSLILSVSVIFPAHAKDSSPKIEVPQIRITTKSGNGTSLQKADGYIDATVSVTDTDSSDFTENASVKVRGNSTAFEGIAKKSYTFKFGKKMNVLNMGNAKKWALVSNIYDPTLARNYTAFSLAQELGIQYTSNFKVVEVWMDNSFRGCYLLFEPVDKGKDRVDIDVNKTEFMLELEALREDDDVKYFKSNGIRFAVSEPDPPSDEQLSSIQSTMDDVISTIINGSKEEIESKIDIESFVKFYLLNEFLKTVDFDFSSVFYYYKEGKLYAGPPWDYDLSSGNVNKDFSSRYASSYKTDGLFISNYNLFKWLCAKPWFYDLAKAEFTEHYSYFASIPAEGGVIDSFYNTYKNVINRNFKDAGWQVNRYYVNVMKRPLATFGENWDFYVNWCKERVSWLTEYFGVDPSAIQTTEEPTTEAPTTQQPATEAPETEAPETEAPATEAPATEASATEPTTSQEPTESTSKPTVTKKKANTIKVTVKTKTVNLNKLKSKKQIIDLLTIKNAKGTTKITIIKSGTSKKIRKKVSVSKKGVFTLKKGKYKKGTYKIKVKIFAKGNSKFKSATINKIITLKIK